jgi:Fe-S-cluster containining protein
LETIWGSKLVTTSGNPASPLGLADEVERLMNMPQSLCKQRGICCQVAVFKGLHTHQDLLAMQAQPDIEGEMARDFASIFVPYPSQAVVRELSPVFVDRVRAFATQKQQDPDQITFYACKYVLADGRCGVHEDRPTGCRRYPIPHKNSLFHPGCGYEATSATNWARIVEILTQLGIADQFL